MAQNDDKGDDDASEVELVLLFVVVVGMIVPPINRPQ